MDQKEYAENFAAEIARVARIMLGDSDDPQATTTSADEIALLIHWGAIVLYCVFSLSSVVGRLLYARKVWSRQRTRQGRQKINQV